jgi:hypothetical protein
MVVKAEACCANMDARDATVNSNVSVNTFFMLFCLYDPRTYFALKMLWEDAMRSFAPLREYYMRHFDSPESVHVTKTRSASVCVSPIKTMALRATHPQKKQKSRFSSPV